MSELNKLYIVGIVMKYPTTFILDKICDSGLMRSRFRECAQCRKFGAASVVCTYRTHTMSELNKLHIVEIVTKYSTTFVLDKICDSSPMQQISQMCAKSTTQCRKFEAASIVCAYRIHTLSELNELHIIGIVTKYSTTFMLDKICDNSPIRSRFHKCMTKYF